MRKLLLQDLRAGDVLLSRGANSALSNLICAIDGSQYSHAALWSGHEVIEAVLDGIQERPLDVSLAMGKRELVHVYRHPAMSPHEPNAVVQAARRFLGGRFAEMELYLLGVVYTAAFALPGRSLREAVKLTFGSLGRELEQLRCLLLAQREAGRQAAGALPRMTCSMLVATAFRDGGLPLTIDVSGARRIARHKGLASQASDSGAVSEAEIEAMLQLFDDCFPELSEDTELAQKSLACGRETKALVCTARDWPLGLVTPRDISTGLQYKGELACRS